MMRRLLAGAFLIAAGLSMNRPAAAEPYLAVQEGYKCNVCHVNPTGGGLRNSFGIQYAKLLLPAQTVAGALDSWTGQLVDNVRVGGDLRAAWTNSSAPNTVSQAQFGLEQVRIYGDVAIIPDRLGVYIDEQVAPNASQNMEAYLRYGSTHDGLYFKGGQFYLPFGWRLQDQTAFVREVTSISMTTPEQGIEVGYEHAAWSAQLDLTNVPAAGANSKAGHQFTGQVVNVQPHWRWGLAASVTQSDVGNRRVGGVFAGLRTGPVAWLGEADLVRDESFPGGRSLATGLLEADWRIFKGHNLKATVESYDPDRSVREDQRARYSLVYEFTPIPFLQLRAGYRRYRGIPQSNSENQRLSFVELHGYF
ncbi:MAG: hypothetical protein QOI88_180 [Gammaproteobacteria bacterium]|jgi:hypothetical protein|nr:hypothetical protein [Gammaproteobacteria bacterium]